MPPLFLVSLVNSNTVNILYLHRKHSQYCFSVLLFDNEKKTTTDTLFLFETFSVVRLYLIMQRRINCQGDFVLG